MSSNVVNFPIIPKATATMQDKDPATAMLEAIDRCEKYLGKHVTAIVIARRFQVVNDIANTFNWRERHRAMLDRKETV
jgi:hypothetical protein